MLEHGMASCKYTQACKKRNGGTLLKEKSCSKHVAKQLATDIPAPGLLVVHDPVRGGENEFAEGAGGEEVGRALLELAGADVEAGRDDAGLVDATVQLNYDLAGAMVIDEFELINVSMALHQGQKLDDDLGGRADEDLALATLLSVDDGLEAVVEY